jgi:LmbE family N-acetylglucosaminyl deacetylase
MKKNILFIVAHPDDELIGCGGTLIKYCNSGHNVHVLILSTGITSREIEENKTIEEIDKLKCAAENASKLIGYNVNFECLPDNKFDSINLLDIVKIIELWIDAINPDIVFTHNYSDLNIDHKITFNAVLTAIRPCMYNVKEFYTFTTLSSSEWQSPSLQKFRPNYFIRLDEKIINTKKTALKFYQDEIRQEPHPRSIYNIINKSKVDGSIICSDYAEIFEAIRIIE